jgi:hypothetical protein
MHHNQLAREVRLILALQRTDQLVSRGESPHAAISHAAGVYEVDEDELRTLWTQKRAAAVAAREELLPALEREPEEKRGS